MLKKGTRTAPVQVRFTPEEKKLLEKQAAAENFANASDFIRKTILDRCKSAQPNKSIK
jgi:uncharacterized protein (DUF1778 family)